MATNRNRVVKDVISTELLSLINNLKRGSRVIQGSLSVSPGHDYWWFLEYGTGEFFGAKDWPTEEVVQPEDTHGYTAEGGAYEINVKDAELLVYMTKRNGLRYMRRKATMHPGIYPIGMVRSALFDAMLYLKQDLKNVTEKRGKRWKDLPRRDDLVELVNGVLAVLLGTLRLYTPDNSDPDPAHEGRNPEPLSEAWRITKAK